MTGLDRGDFPIGLWSMHTTSSSASYPVRSSYAPTRSPRCCFAECSPCSFVSSARSNTSYTRVLFPDPETPVIADTAPRGILTSIPFKLCSRAPVSVSQRGPSLRRGFGTGMVFVPARYCPVIGLSLARVIGPANTTRPPRSPLPGPSSTM
ncbi:MAG: hypothetical protein WD825_06745 [Gemmatimonadaceae bacterium]